MSIAELRKKYHQRICERIICIQKKDGIEYPNFADGSNDASRKISWGIVDRLGCPRNYRLISGQTAGNQFENVTREFLQESFEMLKHLRPGEWIYSAQSSISDFEQYEHLAYLEEVIKHDRKLESALRGGYLIIPDIIIARWPVSDEEINKNSPVISHKDSVAGLTPLRQVNRSTPTKILHASISCKWTIRTDRAQNTRTEALNLIRNRKGHQPHIVAVTAEPTPHRLASLALGTGDLDCVYHFALYELLDSTKSLGYDNSHDEIQMMIEGRRLRDISDLPFDLVI
ncbi:MAG: restriction endonuclease [Anaerolineales bacterium]|nr:restriction endonuclease [Anaerolineales bacterium]